MRTYLKIKRASSNSDNTMNDIGTVGATTAATLGTRNLKAVPVTLGTYTAANLGGDLLGLKGTPTFDEIQHNNRVTTDSLMPGRAAYKDSRRRLWVENKLSPNKDNKRQTTLSETIGPYTAAILPTVGGAMLGGKLFGPTGAVLGGTAGAFLPNLMGAHLGRNSTERDYDDDVAYYGNAAHSVMNYIVPGLASYNKKRSARSADRMLNDINKWDMLHDPNLLKFQDDLRAHGLVSDDTSALVSGD